MKSWFSTQYSWILATMLPHCAAAITEGLWCCSQSTGGEMWLSTRWGWWWG